MAKKFYVVVSRREDGFWTKFKRASFNAKAGEGFDTRLEAIEALNGQPSLYRFRIVELLEPVLGIVLKRTRDTVWR